MSYKFSFLILIFPEKKGAGYVFFGKKLQKPIFKKPGQRLGRQINLNIQSRKSKSLLLPMNV